MSLRSRIGQAVGGAGALAATALATGAVVERRVARTRNETVGSPLGSISGNAVPVTAEDGVVLHCEVDEVAPYKTKNRGPKSEDVTVVFVHGYALNLKSWHFQRRDFRGKLRMVFYDQRSHGLSGKSSTERANIDQLGDDLNSVINTVARKGKLILVGHSMGGMSVLAFAERHPDVFAERVIATALLGTTAGDLKPHKIFGGWVPDSLGDLLFPRVITALASAPDLVDSARRSGSNIGYLASRVFGYGEDADPEHIEFLNEMLDETSMSVLAEFFPNFSALNRFATLGSFAGKPTLVMCGTEDRITHFGHSEKMAENIPGSKLVECEGAGHMLQIERSELVNAELMELVERAAL